jgi:hypothetical protein
MLKNEQGSILIEFVGSFLLFVLLIISILSLVNISTMQARMHYALTQSANMLSMYGYALNVAGVDGFLMESDKRANVVQTTVNADIADINDVLRNINALDVPGVASSADRAAGNIGAQIDGALDDPVQALQYLANYGFGEAQGAGFEVVLRKLVEYYLANGDMSGDEYLRSVGVDGAGSLQFHKWESAVPGYTPPSESELVGSIDNIPDDGSLLLNEGGNVKITVQYEMAYSFMGLDAIMPFEPKLKVTQAVMTKMWLGGRGERYERN